MSTGEQIRMLRIQKGLTQRDLSIRTGINEANISKYERDKQNLRLETLERIATALDVHPAEILGHDYWDAKQPNIGAQVKHLEAFEAYLVSIGYAVNYQAAGDEEIIITVKKFGREHDFTSAEFQAFQAEIEQSVEYQLWKKNRKDK